MRSQDDGQAEGLPRRKVWHAGSLTYSRTGLLTLFFWLLWGDFAYFLKERSVPMTVQLLLHRFQVSDFFVGLLLGSLPTAVGILAGPVVAYHSDRHRGRWGRRIPFLIAPVPLTMAAMSGLAFSPAIGRGINHLLGHWSPGENTCTVMTLAGSWTLFEFGAGISYSIFLSLIADVVPREVIARFFALFRIVSLTAGILFNYYLLGRVERHYVPVFLGIGAIYCVGFTAMCLAVKEDVYPPAPAALAVTGAGVGALLRRFALGVKSYVRECFALPYYRWVFLSFALYWVAMVPLDLFAVFYAKSLNMSMTTLGKYGALQLTLSLVQAYPIGWLADRFHPLRMTIVALFLLIASTWAGFFLVHDARGFGIAYVVCGTLTGTWGTAIASVPAVLFAKPKFAMLNSAWLMSNAVGAMIAGPACGWLLDSRQHNYRYTFLWEGLVGVLALGALLVVYRKFNSYGGALRYVAPA